MGSFNKFLFSKKKVRHSSCVSHPGSPKKPEQEKAKESRFPLTPSFSSFSVNILSSSLIFQISHTVFRESVHNEIFLCGIFPGFHLEMAFLFLFSQKDSPFPRPHKSSSAGEMGQLGRSV